MKIKVTSRGETEFKLDPQYEEPAVREVLGRADSDIASEVTEYTDIERSNISHDEYAVVTEDDGT
ncbi:MAG TPA: hypothetical protein VGH54_17925, partial [Mycobacterium sp.]|uniref:hypothetical protein n=1 Tax=Mycobacterium sp. TaxID=1785 RepID=UPI002F3FAF25